MFCPECKQSLSVRQALDLYAWRSSPWRGPTIECPRCLALLKPKRWGRDLVGLLTVACMVLVLLALISHVGTEVRLAIAPSILAGFLGSVPIGFIVAEIMGCGVVQASPLDPEQSNAIRPGTNRKCPHCRRLVSSEARTCPSCGQKLYPPLRPTTHDKIGSLLKQIDKQSLTSPPEEYFTKTQEHAWNRQVKEAALELGKVLLTSKPKSETHLKAERLLKKMGYRF